MGAGVTPAPSRCLVRQTAAANTIAPFHNSPSCFLHHRIDRPLPRGSQHSFSCLRASLARAIINCMDAPITLRLIVRKYLDWCGKHRAPRTVEWYQGHLDGFLTYLGNEALMHPSSTSSPHHVVEWVDSHQNWGDTYKRGAIVAVQRAMNWAEEMGYLAASPVKKVKKPPCRRRDNPMTPEDFQTFLVRLRQGDPFRDLFLFLWHSGCRPQEARHIEPRHVQLDQERIVIPKDEAKGKALPAVSSYLHGPALEIVTRLDGRCRPRASCFATPRADARGRSTARCATACTACHS